MPIPSYDTADQVPEAQRSDYRQGKDGRYYAVLEDRHPLVAKKTELTTTVNSNKDKVLQHGQRAVTIEEFNLLNGIKSLSIPTAEVVTRLQEYPTLKERETAAARASAYEQAAKFLKYPNLDAFKTTLELANVEVTFKEEAVAGTTDKVQVPYVGEKRLSEHIDATPQLKTMEPFFKVAPQTPAPRTEAGSGSRPAAATTSGSSAGTSGAGQSNGGEQTRQEPPKQFVFNQPGDVVWPE